MTWKFLLFPEAQETRRTESMPPPIVQSNILQVLLDVPERAGTGLQLRHFVFSEGHVDHADHAPTVQHTGQTQVHLVTDAIHALLPW